MDESLKRQAETLFENMGLNMTTALNVFVRTVVRDGKLPFEVVSDDYALRQQISAKLHEAQDYAQKPDAVYHSHDEVFGKVREKLGYEV
jgi:DNA-damage-inducible protein J